MIESNIQEIIKGLDDLGRKQLPFILRETANDVAFETMRDARKLVSMRFLNGIKLAKAIRVKKATKKKPEAEVFVDDYVPWKQNALVTQERGGDRRKKAFEKAMIRAGYLKQNEIITPDSSIVRGWVYVQIMSQLHLNDKAGYTANETKRSLQRKKRKRQYKEQRYMIVTSNKYAYTAEAGVIKKRRTGLAPGIYVKRVVVDEIKNVRILKIGRKPHYTKRWDLQLIVKQVYAKRGYEYFSKNFDKAMASAWK